MIFTEIFNLMNYKMDLVVKFHNNMKNLGFSDNEIKKHTIKALYDSLINVNMDNPLILEHIIKIILWNLI